VSSFRRHVSGRVNGHGIEGLNRRPQVALAERTSRERPAGAEEAFNVPDLGGRTLCAHINPHEGPLARDEWNGVVQVLDGLGYLNAHDLEAGASIYGVVFNRSSGRRRTKAIRQCGG